MADFSELVRNRTNDFGPGTFDRQEPQGSDFNGSYGARVEDNADLSFSVWAPEAKSVSVRFNSTFNDTRNAEIVLEKDAEGFFRALVPYDPANAGPHDFMFYVDGAAMLHPLVNTYFRGGHLSNCVEIPDEKLPEILIKDVPHGALTLETYFSAAMDKWQRCIVYTPAEYRHTDTAYPVLYLVHGGSENETSWTFAGKVSQIMDNLIAEGRAKPMLVVMNDGMTHRDDEGGHAYESYVNKIIYDCIPLMEREYRVRKDKWGRAAAGVSRGGPQTTCLGMAHPELFGWLGYISGPMKPVGFGDSALANATLEAAKKDPAKLEEDFKLILRCCGSAEVDTNKGLIFSDNFCAETGIDKLNCYCRIVFEDSKYHDWSTFRRGLVALAPRLF